MLFEKELRPFIGTAASNVKSEYPFNVFAPINEAFAKPPAGTVDNLVKAEHNADLTKILTYHVVPNTLTAKQLMADAKILKDVCVA